MNRKQDGEKLFEQVPDFVPRMVRLTRIRNLTNDPTTSLYSVGFWVEGLQRRPLTLGDPLELTSVRCTRSGDEFDWFKTSPALQVDGDTVTTQNSVWQISPVIQLRGRLNLMQEEGGCVSSAAAAALYLTNPTKKHYSRTVRKAARENQLIAIRDRRAVRFPVWQFTKGGGALPGLARVLAELSKRIGYSEITPFVFFLQYHPRTSGRPLDALRDGRVDDAVAAAVCEHD